MVEALGRIAAAPLWVGFSGGLDSSVLLHALAALPAARERGLQALHIDHGLHPNSAQWAHHCRDFAARLAVPFTAARVQIKPDQGLGPEAAARRARMQVFAQTLAAGGYIALAHHADDQAETLLLRLLRASGSAGLAGMRECRPLAAGYLWRPLLETPRMVLRAYAERHALAWIDDPANENIAFDRNRIRHRVMPAFRERWPDVATRLARSARLLREEADALMHDDAQRLAQARGADPTTLRCLVLHSWAAADRRRVVRLWLSELGLPMPPAAVIDPLDAGLLDPPADAEPRLAWPGAEIRRYRDLLYARPLPAHGSEQPGNDWSLIWDGAHSLPLPNGFGTLWLEPAPATSAIADRIHWTVRPRQGGERIRLPGRAGHHRLKHVLQEQGIPPWQRRQMPLLFDRNGELLAAGDRIHSERFRQWQEEHGCRLHWRPPDAQSPTDPN